MEQYGATIERGIIEARINGEKVLASVDRPGLEITLTDAEYAGHHVGEMLYFFLHGNGKWQIVGASGGGEADVGFYIDADGYICQRIAGDE